MTTQATETRPRYRVTAHGGVWSRTDDLTEALADAQSQGTAKVHDVHADEPVATYVMGSRLGDGA